MSFAVGDALLCNGKQATVRFVGATEFAPGSWVGVEFRHPTGKNDGSVDGVSYFGPCQANHGLFVKAGSPSLCQYSAEEEAATKLQAQVRRKQSAQSTEYKQASKAFNAMESQTEAEVLRINANSARTDAILAREGQAAPEKHAFSSTQKLSLPRLEADDQLAKEFDPEDRTEQAPVVAGSGTHAAIALRSAVALPEIVYKRAEIGGPAVTRESLENVVTHFKRHPTVYLPADRVKALIVRGRERFRLDVPEAVFDLTTPEPPGRSVVLGDTHGQLNDVLWVFFEHGEPSRDNVYLFNGDVVDRGGNATEILLIILLYKLWEPSCIHFNRGNHEDVGMNESYGFMDECIRKWGEVDGGEIFDLFNDLFQCLPLFTVIDQKVFVVHGGLWRNRIFQMETLRKVDFQRPVPCLPTKAMDYLFADALWSDPQEPKGIGGNSRGDSIISFGPDITNRFLDRNGLRLLVRSHQLPLEGGGYEMWHGAKCVTLFSASNYCGDCGNYGAVLLLSRDQPDQFCEYYAPEFDDLMRLEAEADRALTRVRAHAQGVEKRRQFKKRATQQMTDQVITKVQEWVVQKRMELFEYWSSVDKSPVGVFTISASVWREGCTAILDPDGDIPWTKVQEALCVTGNTGEVHYLKFLTRYRVAYDAGEETSVAGWEAAIWSRIMEMLLRADLPLREALAAIDSTNDGHVSIHEFGKLLESCRAGISALQARKMLQTIAAHSSERGKVDLWKLLERLQVTLPIAPAGASEENAWVVKALRPLATAVLDDAASRLVPFGQSLDDWPASRLLAMWFEDADTSRSGYLEFSEYIAALTKLRPKLQKNGCPSSDEELASIATYCDVMGNGRINYFELLNGLTWGDSIGPDLREDLVQGIHATIYFNRPVIRHALAKFDQNNSGVVSRSHFTNGLQAVFTALTASSVGEELTRPQIDMIAKSLPEEPGGGISFSKFLDSFRIVDAREEFAMSLKSSNAGDAS